MGSRLTDAELIQLVQEKLPEELTHEEILQLHERLRESTELKVVLIEQLHMETYLSAALSEINVSVDEIVKKAGELQKTRSTNRWPFWTGLAGLFVLAGFGIYFATRPAPGPQQLAGGPDPAKTENKTVDPPQLIAKNAPTEPIENLNNSQNETKTAPSPQPVSPQPVASADMTWGQPTDPWYDALNPNRPPLPLTETAERMPAFSYGEFLSKAEASRWLERAPGHSLELQDREKNKDRWVEAKGVGRLKAPWVEKSVLRVSLFDMQDFRLHFWNAEGEGVTLAYYPQRHPRVWAAYRSARAKNKSVPESLEALLTTDDGRQSRVRSGLMEIRLQAGTLLVSQGYVELLQVPFSGSLTDVIFDGRCMLSEITMYRGEEFPIPEEPKRWAILASSRPADAVWFTRVPGQDLREGIRELGQAKESGGQWREDLGEGVTVIADDGTLQLETEKADRPCQIATRLPRPGFYEVIFRIDEATPGTALFFGDREGNELHRIGFFHDRQADQTVFDSSRAYETHIDVDRHSRNSPVAYFAKGHWIRAVWGFGNFKIWTSGDGRHWGMWSNPTTNLPGPYSTIGLSFKKSDKPAKIALSHWEVRELSTITSLATNAARTAVPDFGDLGQYDFGTWQEKVIATRPMPPEEEAPFSLEEWRRACAIRSLAESPWSSISSTLLRGLLEYGLDSADKIEDKYRLLDEVSLLYDLRDGNAARAMTRMYERLGGIAADRGQAAPFHTTIDRLRRAPIWSESNMNVISPEFTREMLLEHAYGRNWAGLRSATSKTEFLMLASHPQQTYWWDKDERGVLEWADALAHRKAPDLSPQYESQSRRLGVRRQWQHPLVTQVSKEGYNVIAEFEAALAGDAFEDACRIITSAGQSGMAGLLPDSNDPDLLVSLPRAIAIAMKDHPELQSTMREKFGEIGRVRVREAMTRADVEAVEAATVRFYGTAAAAEAHRWIGDRALASGRFGQAAQAYQEALAFAEPPLDRDVANRLRLAASLLGHDVPQETTSPVEIASASWSETEFERLVAELKKTHARAENASLADWDPSLLERMDPPPPARWNAVVRNQFSGDLGNGVGRYEDRNTDWVARQMAVALDGDRMFVSNRFQVVCYQSSDGKTCWSRGLGGEQGDVSHWSMIPMRPLVVGEQIYVRRLTKRGPELACLHKSDGKVLWQIRPEHHVASDPVFVSNRLLAIVATMPQSGFWQLELTAFHPDTGDVLSSRPILHLQDDWGGRPPCQILATNGRILCTIGGATLCCDSLGQPQWLQQHPWFSPRIDRASKHQHHQPPLVTDGKVFTAQAGVKEVSCLELQTGRKVWSRPVTDIERIIGQAGACLVVQTEMGFIGLDQNTGNEQWRHLVPDLLNACLIGDGQLVYARSIDYAGDGNVCLVWLEAKSGRELSHALLRAIEGDGLRFGPMISHQGKFWAFLGRGFKEAQRELVELVPEANAEPAGPLSPSDFASWSDNILPRSFVNTAIVLPGWTIGSTQNFSGREKGAQLLDEFRGEKDVLKTRTGNERPVHFLRKLDLPAGKPSHLNLRLGHEPGQFWTVEVKIGPQVLVTQTIDDQTAPNGWRDVTVDVSKWAGRSVWVLVVQKFSDDKKAGPAYWKALQ